MEKEFGRWIVSSLFGLAPKHFEGIDLQHEHFFSIIPVVARTSSERFEDGICRHFGQNSK